MDALKRRRAPLRTAFTKAYNAYNEKVAEAPPREADITIAYEILEERYADLKAVQENIIETLLSADTIVEADILKEQDDSDVYHRKFLDARYRQKERSTKRHVVSTPQATEQNSESNSFLLPKMELIRYDGSVRDWLTFWSLFKKIHEHPSMAKEDKFHYLIKSLVPGSRAAELIESFPPTAGNYEKAIESLKNRFGDKDLQVEVYFRELIQLTMKPHAVSLATLYDKIEAQLRSLESLGVVMGDCAFMLLPLIESALPEELLRAWQRSCNLQPLDETVPKKERGTAKLNRLISFMAAEVKGDLRVDMARKGFDVQMNNNDAPMKSNSKFKNSASAKNVPSAVDLLATKTRDNKCIFCDANEHASKDCRVAAKLSTQDKRTSVKQKRGCFNCLKIGHNAKDCRVAVKCDKCGRRHVTLMRYADEKLNSKSMLVNCSKDASASCALASLNDNPEVFLKTLKVKLCGNDKTVIVRALIDSGSQNSYITKAAAALVNYEPVGKRKMNHSLFSGQMLSSIEHKKYKVYLSAVQGEYNCNFVALDQEVICNEVPSPRNGIWNKELSAKKIEISDMNSDEEPISILIGSDIGGKIKTGRLLQLRCGLTAEESLLGWTLRGKVPGMQAEENKAVTALYMYVSECKIEELWALDVLGIKDPIAHKSQLERETHASTEFLKTVYFNAEGRYEAELPFLDNHSPIGDNKRLSMCRLQAASEKLRKNFMFEKYDAVFKEWIAEGIIEYVPKEEEDCWGHYVPHRPVIKENSTTPVRPVFDASAKEGSYPSLNDCLEKGLNLIELVTDILLRFRLGKIGVIADIRKAFLQISISPKNRDFLRFFWFDEDNNVVKMRHRRVVFGVRSSPFMLGIIIQHHLQQILNANNKQFSVELIQKLKNSFYVDNCVASVNSQEELNEFIAQARIAMELAGFDLRGWEYSQQSASENQAAVLGISWDKASDTLALNLSTFEKINLETVTKRSILSSANKIFDPLGFACPVTLIPRLLLQEAWAKNLGWDDEVDDDIRDRFVAWANQIQESNKIKIPRCFLEKISDESNISLHTFCDASKMAYAAVTYIRVERNNVVNVNLVQAKTRVAPAKNDIARHSIPRLELLGATIATRLTNSIIKALDLKGDVPIYYWTDSTTVLAWIRRENNWGTFVYNRIKEIRDFSNPNMWRHVPGPLNPADLPSRGCSSSQLLSSRWWEGPE